VILDEFVPEFDFCEEHAVTVRRAPGPTFTAIKAIRPGELPVTRLLMGVRSLPSLVVGRRVRPPENDKTLLEQAVGMGFLALGEEQDRELVLGLIAQPWKLAGGGIVNSIRTPDDFLAFDDPSVAKIATNFLIDERPEGCRLSTETRIRVEDPEARRRFARYWFVIRPGSGIIRREWLRRIKVRAETEAGSASLTTANEAGRSRYRPTR
jgi:hypothetical protein